MNNIVLLASMEAEEAAKKARDNGASLDDRAREAMRATASHWMATNEDDQFLAACEGLARTCDEDEREAIERSLRVLSALSAATSGVPVDFDRLLGEDDDPALTIKLIPLWREVKDTHP